MNLKNLIIKNIKKNKKLFVEFSFCFILSSCALTINPFFISRIIGCFNIELKSIAINDIIFWLCLFVIFKLLQAINQYFVRVTKSTFEAVLNANIIDDLFSMVHQHNIRYFDDELTGRISTAITKTSGTLGAMFINTLYGLIRPFINFLLAFGIIGYTSPKLAFFLILICLPFFLVLKFLDKRIRKLWQTRGTAEQDYYGFTTDSITNYKLVRYTGSLFTEKLNAFKILKKYLRATYNCESQRAVFIAGVNLLESVFTLSCYTAIIYFTLKQGLSLADAYFAFSSIQMLNISLHGLNRFFQELSENYGELTASIELIYKPIEIKDKPNAKNIYLKKATITFKNIDFSYIPEKQIFKDLNLTISAGEKVGLVGLSGAGKSTLISLLLRSYLPQSGKIMLNRYDIANITEVSLHKNIAYVPQDVTLFNRSLYENLKIGNPKADKNEIIKAAKLAYIHETIKELENGYDSVVGERGILLSGGERQRIAIARAILQNAPVLILDEATSALDSEAEIMVQNALENLMKNKTVIAVAHRLSTLRSMDRIIVLDNGEIIEDDTPKNLLKKKNGLFKHLFDLQVDGYIKTKQE